MLFAKVTAVVVRLKKIVDLLLSLTSRRREGTDNIQQRFPADGYCHDNPCFCDPGQYPKGLLSLQESRTDVLVSSRIIVANGSSLNSARFRKGAYVLMCSSV